MTTTTTKKLTAKAGGHSYEAFVAVGWTDEQLKAAGYLEATTPTLDELRADVKHFERMAKAEGSPRNQPGPMAIELSRAKSRLWVAEENEKKARKEADEAAAREAAAEAAARRAIQPVSIRPVAMPGAHAMLPSELQAAVRFGKNAEVIPDEENIGIILERDPALQGVVRFNEFTGELIVTRPITADASVVGERGMPRPWTDEDTIVLQRFIQRYIIPKVGRDRIEAVVSQHAKHRCAFHPIRDYLQSLAWDQTPRLDTWLKVYFGAERQPDTYLSAVGTAWLISAVARIFEPGCKADCALVLEGAQGTFKSTALRTLAGSEYFSDSLSADLSHKDARDHLRGKWIIELAELSQFKRSEIETVKAFVSRQEEQYRPSYGRHEIKFPRQCIFAGSTNDETYLVDRTGNRRWWTVSCKRVDLAALVRDRDQLWAEATARYRAGEPWWLSEEVKALADTEASLRVAHDPWTADVEKVTAEMPGTDVSPGEVLSRLSLPATERHDRSSARVGQILRDLGWQRGKRHMTRGQLYVRPGVPVPPPVYQYRHNDAPAPGVQPAPSFIAPPPPPPTPATPSHVIDPIADLKAAQQLVEVLDAFESLGRPAAVRCVTVADTTPRLGWLTRPQYAREVPAVFQAAGYTPVRNPARKDGLWCTNPYVRTHVEAIYGRADLSDGERVTAAMGVAP